MSFCGDVYGHVRRSWMLAMGREKGATCVISNSFPLSVWRQNGQLKLRGHVGVKGNDRGKNI